MSDATRDPYAVLGVDHDVSDIELRRVYRELVKRHHPDHNGGSAESARRFAQIQNAYAVIAELRRTPHAVPDAGPADAEPIGTQYQAPDPNLEDRIQRLEQELAQMREAEQRQARERARQVAAQQAAARKAAARQPAAGGPRAQAHRAAAGGAQAQARRPTPEQLGYYTTDDSFTKIIDDATEQVADRLLGSNAKREFTRRLSGLFGRGDSDSRGRG